MVWYDRRLVYDVVWYGKVWYGMVWYMWYDKVCYGKVWYGIMWYGKVWYKVCYSMVWYGIACSIFTSPRPNFSPDLGQTFYLAWCGHTHSITYTDLKPLLQNIEDLLCILTST